MVDGQEEPRNKHVAAAVSIVKLVLNQWLVIGFGLACLFAYLWPSEKDPSRYPPELWLA